MVSIVEVSNIRRRVEATTRKTYFFFTVNYSLPNGESYFSPRNKIYTETAPTKVECEQIFIKEKIKHAKSVVDFWKAFLG